MTVILKAALYTINAVVRTIGTLRSVTFVSESRVWLAAMNTEVRWLRVCHRTDG
jgi:hypothetical protein